MMVERTAKMVVGDLEGFDGWLTLLREVTEPVYQYLSPGKARVVIPGPRARYSRAGGEIEAWSRPLWGLIPATVGLRRAGRALPPWLATRWESIRTGLIVGTDPTHGEYWGRCVDFDQRFVEMAAIALALSMCPEQTLHHLDTGAIDRIGAWLDQITRRSIPDNNWRFFRVLVTIALRDVGRRALHVDGTRPPWFDEDRLGSVMHGDLDRLEAFFLGDGWYSDGDTEQRDYYVAFAMHFYGVVYGRLRGDEDGSRAERFARRARRFAEDFRWWFDRDGRAIAFGRSQTYRFAQGAFWAAYACDTTLSTERRSAAVEVLRRHVRWWATQEIVRPDGVLSVGYGYANLHMAEEYNAAGSPGWGLKSLWFLSEGPDAPWWGAAVADDPFAQLGDHDRTATRCPQPHARTLLVRDRGNHAWMVNAGQYAGFSPKQMPEKYTKYAYSSRFGFGVSTDRRGLTHCSVDSTTVVSDDGLYWRHREETRNHRVDETGVRSEWTLWSGAVGIDTVLSPTAEGYDRVHLVRTDRALMIVDGGFAVPHAGFGQEWVTREDDQRDGDTPWGVVLRSPWEGAVLTSGVRLVSHRSHPDAREADPSRRVHPSAPEPGVGVHGAPPDSHLLFRQAVVPIVVLKLEPGTHEIRIATIFGVE